MFLTLQLLKLLLYSDLENKLLKMQGKLFKTHKKDNKSKKINIIKLSSKDSKLEGQL